MSNTLNLDLSSVEAVIEALADPFRQKSAIYALLSISEHAPRLMDLLIKKISEKRSTLHLDTYIFLLGVFMLLKDKHLRIPRDHHYQKHLNQVQALLTAPSTIPYLTQCFEQADQVRTRIVIIDLLSELLSQLPDAGIQSLDVKTLSALLHALQDEERTVRERAKNTLQTLDHLAPHFSPAVLIQWLAQESHAFGEDILLVVLSWLTKINFSPDELRSLHPLLLGLLLTANSKELIEVCKICLNLKI